MKVAATATTTTKSLHNINHVATKMNACCKPYNQHYSIEENHPYIA